MDEALPSDDRGQWADVARAIADELRSGSTSTPTDEQVAALTAALEQRETDLQRRLRDQIGTGDQPQRFWFTHVMKTGGTSMLATLRNQFDGTTYPAAADGDAWNDRAYVTPWKLVEAFAYRGASIRLVAGHLPHHASRLVPVPFTTITVLRDPLERTLSYLRQLRRETERDDPPSLEEIYERPGPHQALLGNHLVKVFSLTGDEAMTGIDQPLPVTSEHLPIAIETVRSIDHVGFTDRLGELWQALERAHGWDLGPELRLNTGSERDGSPSALVRRIEGDITLDRELYEAAVEHATGSR